MWTKTIIVDKTVRRVFRSGVDAQFAYAFAGFDESGKDTWTSNADAVKLYDSTADAITDAKKLREELPVDVLIYSIAPETKAVTITTVKF